METTLSEQAPVVLRNAATVMMVRDGPDGDSALEVLMVRRNLNSDFVGGAYVFPGGAVDPTDGGPEAEALSPARSDAVASAILEVPTGGLAYWVAVLRELFEEAGVLLATRADGSLLSFARNDDERRFVEHRRALNAGQRRFLDICGEERLLLAVERVHYFAHWVTPQGAPRRYDTRFFVAAAPPDQTPAHDAAEVIDETWLSPKEALRLHREGQIDLIFPTIRNLQAIARFERSSDLLDAAAAAGHVPLIEPRVVVDGRAMRILLPGDPGYGEAVAARPGSGGDFNEAIRIISAAANQGDEEG